MLLTLKFVMTAYHLITRDATYFAPQILLAGHALREMKTTLLFATLTAETS